MQSPGGPRTLRPSAEQTMDAAYIATCSGLHVIPAIPPIPGTEHIGASSQVQVDGPRVFHSADYKKRAQLTGKRVMILGTGETGMDLAYEAARGGAKEVVLCSRGGYVDNALRTFLTVYSFLSFPKQLARIVWCCHVAHSRSRMISLFSGTLSNQTHRFQLTP